MPNGSPIEFDHLGIGNALRRNLLTVPLHQREYSWTKKEVLELLQDLTSAINENKGVYFLGTIVLTRVGDDSRQVIDGQQRLATTTIILAAIRDYFFEKNVPMLVTALEEFLFIIVRDTLDRTPRLALNVDDNEYFKNRIVMPPKSKERKKAKASRPSHVLIDSAAKVSADHLKDLIHPFAEKDRTRYLNSWVTFLEKSAQVMLVTAPDDVNAFIMFETLNDRGLGTTQADLVKNYLFSKTSERIREAQQKWAAMQGVIEALDGELTLTYIRHFTISRYGHTRERDVLERIRSNVQHKLHAIQFLQQLAESANDYVALSMPEHSAWNRFVPTTRGHVQMLARTLKVTTLRPVMLAVLQRFPKKHIEKSFKMFVCWSLRIMIAGSLRSAIVEGQIARSAAQGVANGTIDTASKLLDAMSRALPSDIVFCEEFGKKRVSQSELARYILRSLELKRQGNPEPEWIPNNDVVVNLEHVLPVKPKGSWGGFEGEAVATYQSRIGNLVLLRASANSTVGNQPFSEKKKEYRSSTFLMTQDVAKYNSWGPKELEDRQRQMAELAVETWPLS